ncbi:MAG: hypothetical protein QNL21_02105 [Flavobacteriales bacterium]
MKRTTFTIVAILAIGGMFAQTSSMEESNAKALEIVEASLAETESYTEVYGLMIARLSEEASQTDLNGSALISFEEFIQMLEASIDINTYTNADGESVSIASEPSMALLDDGVNATPPIRLENETTLDYVQRLAILTESTDVHHDYVVIATTGGELGLVYAHVTASANGIRETDVAVQLRMFPNPVSDVLTLAGLPAGTFPGKLLDAQGKTILELSLIDGKQIDLSGYAVGFYTLSVLVNEEIITEKLQVRR